MRLAPQRSFVSCAAVLLTASVVTAAEPARSEPKATIIHDDAGIEEYWGRSKPTRVTEAEPAAGPPLTRDEITAGMRDAETVAKACGRAAGARGSIVVRMIVSKNGAVVTAIVTGPLAGSPFGMCVERAVKSVRFRRNQGLSLNYPFLFQPKAGAPDCGRTDGAAPQVNAATIQQLAVPLGLCAAAGGPALTIPFRLSDDGQGVIRAVEVAPPHTGTRAGLCIARALACLPGSVADSIPVAWEVDVGRGSRATLRPLQ